MKILSISGKKVKVDDEDAEWLSMMQWHINSGYCKRHFGSGKLSIKIFMHKLILGLHMSDAIVDHIDRDRLNNQKQNLRVASRNQNGYNRSPSKSGTSKYLGVAKRYNNKWQAIITTNGVSKSIGTFDDEIEAAITYNLMARLLHGEFAYQNPV